MSQDDQQTLLRRQMLESPGEEEGLEDVRRSLRLAIAGHRHLATSPAAPVDRQPGCDTDDPEIRTLEPADTIPALERARHCLLGRVLRKSKVSRDQRHDGSHLARIP